MLKNLNAVLYNYSQDNPIFMSIIVHFCTMLLFMDVNTSSISKSLAITLVHEQKILQSFFSYNLRPILS